MSPNTNTWHDTALSDKRTLDFDAPREDWGYGHYALAWLSDGHCEALYDAGSDALTFAQWAEDTYGAWSLDDQPNYPTAFQTYLETL